FLFPLFRYRELLFTQFKTIIGFLIKKGDINIPSSTAIHILQALSSTYPKHSFTFQSPFGQIIAEPIFSNIDTLPAAIGLNKIHFHTSNESSATPFIRGRQDPSAIRRPAVVLIAITV